jgi:hypothetical protein
MRISGFDLGTSEDLTQKNPPKRVLDFRDFGSSELQAEFVDVQSTIESGNETFRLKNRSHVQLIQVGFDLCSVAICGFGDIRQREIGRL